MKFLALALDYDGTIASSDVLNPNVRDAIAEIRALGIFVLIVTGRILDDLRRVAGDLHVVDAVVAENGAVLEFPDSGYATLLGAPPSSAFLEELRRKAILFTSGRSIVEADSKDAPRILAVIQQLELPLVLVFNRGRVMVLPQAISKATGLRQALAILRISLHNTVAIGDAENDHELLQSCELGTAVAWGSEALKASADCVLPGNGPEAVAGYIRELAKNVRIPVSSKARRSLLIGYTDDGQPFRLAVQGRTVLVAGDTKSGKSWITGLLCEQMILYGYSLLILDPEGDYTSLEALPGVMVYGGADPLPRPRDLLRSLRHADMTLVIDLSHTPHLEKLHYIRSVLQGAATLRRCTGLPHRIVIDEAHYYLSAPDSKEILDLALNSYTLVTYRASDLHPDVLANAEAILVSRESNPCEISALYATCRDCRGKLSEADWARLLDGLVIGEAAVLPLTAEAGGDIRRVRLAPRLTPHARHLAKYIDIPVPKQQEFVFWKDGRVSGQRARTVGELVTVIENSPAADLEGHVRRHDFSKWIENVFGDYSLAKTVRLIEDSGGGQTSDLISRIAEAIRSRYEFADPLFSLRS